MPEEWNPKNHLANLEQILEALQWLLQPDTIFTELAYDLEYLAKSDIERFAEWSRKAVSKVELNEGKFTVNKPMIRFFVQRAYPDLTTDKSKEKIEYIFKELYKLLNLSAFEPLVMNEQNIDKVIDIMNSIPGESHFDKTKKRIKIAVSLKWLQEKSLFDRLSEPTRAYISKLVDNYVRAKKGENVYAKDIGAYSLPPDDMKILADDYEMKVELSLMMANQDIKKAKDRAALDPQYGQLVVVKEAVSRLQVYLANKNPEEYDDTELFKDTVFIAIILNYIQDPYVNKTNEAMNLIRLILPIYSKYKELNEL